MSYFLRVLVKALFAISILMTYSNFILAASKAVERPKATKALMYQKLNHAQLILQSLMIGDKKNLVSNLEQLKNLSVATTWYKSDNEDFQRYSGNFREAIDRMIEYEKKGNQEGVSMGYIQLTLSCMNCHEKMRDQ